MPIAMFGETFSFDEMERRLSDLKETKRWMNWVKTQVRVGIELEKAGTVNGYTTDGRSRRSIFPTALEASGSYEKLSRYNVVNLTHDGTVHGAGHEILVVGNIEDFATAHRKMAALHKLFNEYGLKSDQSCGMHYHLVAAQDDMLPQIVVKNLYQLVRRYYAALIYMTGTSASPEHIVRHAHFRSRYSRDTNERTHYFGAAHLAVSPINKTMQVVKEEINRRVTRYCAFNMGTLDRDDKNLMHFNGENVSRFHVEFRFPDASDSSAQIISQMFLFRALLMKAVELSQFGVLKADSDGENWKRNKLAVAVLQDDRGDFDVPSDIAMTFAEAVAFAKSDAQNLLTSLRGHLMNIDGASFDVLRTIIEKPVWQRRRGRATWTRIEETLMPGERVLEEIEKGILRIISLQQLTGVKIIQHWKTAAARALGVTEKEVVNAFRSLEKTVKLDFDRELGTFVVVW